MPATRTIAALALAAGAALAAAQPASAQVGTVTYVCTFDQVLPGFGFVPLTLSPEVYGFLGGDPNECVTPVPGFETPRD